MSSLGVHRENHDLKRTAHSHVIRQLTDGHRIATKIYDNTLLLNGWNGAVGNMIVLIPGTLCMNFPG